MSHFSPCPAARPHRRAPGYRNDPSDPVLALLGGVQEEDGDAALSLDVCWRRGGKSHHEAGR